MLTRLIVFITFVGITFTTFSAEKTYQNGVISVTIPESWNIVEENGDEAFGSVVIEKKGFSSSGVVTLTWTDNASYEEASPADLTRWVAETVQEWHFTEVAIPRPAQITYGKFMANHIVVTTRLFIWTAACCSYEMNFYNFGSEHYSLYVASITAPEDKADNQAGFTSIEKSLRISKAK